jgi:hypothetical protein
LKNTPATQDYFRGITALGRSDVAGCVMELEFYQGLAQRVRVIADKADPFTRRRLLERYDAK